MSKICSSLLQNVPNKQFRYDFDDKEFKKENVSMFWKNQQSCRFYTLPETAQSLAGFHIHFLVRKFFISKDCRIFILH